MPDAHRFIDPVSLPDAVTILVQIWVEKKTHPTALNWVQAHCGKKRIRKPKKADGHTVLHLPEVQISAPSLLDDLDELGFVLVHAYGALREDEHGRTIRDKGAVTLILKPKPEDEGEEKDDSSEWDDGSSDDENKSLNLSDPKLSAVNLLIGEMEDSDSPLTFSASYAWSNPNGVATIHLDGINHTAPVPGLISLRADEQQLWLEQRHTARVKRGILDSEPVDKPEGITVAEAHELSTLVLEHS